MSATIYLLTICLPLGTILLIFAMRSYASVQQAKARLASDDSFRQLAAAAASAQAQTNATLASIDATLAELKGRLGAVERMLKEVE